MAMPAAVLSVLVNANTGGAAANLTRLDKRLKGTAAQSEAMSARVTKAAKYAGVGIAAGVVGSIYAAAKFESAFAEVRKTVDTNEKGFKRIERGLRDLALHIPVSANELANLAGEAGALGIKSRDIVKFTKTASMLGTTTDMAGTDAANALARLSNIMDTKGKKAFARMGSTLVDLGNKGASTESEIADMALRIAGAGKTLGLTEAQVLGLSSSLANVGIRAEMGGSAISRVMLQMQEAIAKSGPELQNFAEIAGMTAEQFVSQFERSAPAAIAKFAEGLGKISRSGQPLIATLRGVELGETRVRDTLLRIAGNTRQFTDAQNVANRAWGANTALTEEARKRYATLESQLTMLKNAVIEGGISIGQKMLPDVKELVRVLRNPRLTFDEKVDAVMRLASKALSNGLELMAEQSAQRAPGVAAAFVKGFFNANIWGQLAIGGFLLAKFGGKAAFVALGRSMGIATGGAMASSTVATARTGIAASFAGTPIVVPVTIALIGGDMLKDFLKDKMGESSFDNMFPGVQKNFDDLMQGLGVTTRKRLGEVTLAIDRESGRAVDAAKRYEGVKHKFRQAVDPLPGVAGKAGQGINRAFLPKLDQLVTQGGKKGDAFAGRVSGSFGGLSGNVGSALQTIIANTQRALASLGLRGALRQFALSHPSFVYGTGTTPNQAKQTGGMIVPGTGSGDKFHTALPAGSFILNREASKASAFAKGGLMPVALEPGERVFTPPEVAKVGLRNLEAANKAVPRFQRGGQLGKPQLAGPAGPLLDMGQGAIDKVYEAAKDYLDKHRPKGGVGGASFGPKGIGTYKGLPMANWVIEALQYAASKGVAPQPTSGYRSHAENVAAGRNYFSEHEGTQYPHGAVDFGGYTTGLAAKMAVVNATKSFKYPLLAPIGFRDDGHASGTGHQLGGLIQKLIAGGQIVGASTYGGPADSTSGTVGAAGVSLPGKMAFAELDMGKALGGLNFGAKLRISRAGRSVIGEKLDIGLGGGDVQGHHRAIDLWYETANALGLPDSWLGTVRVADAGGAAGLTEGQRTIQQARARKAHYESQIAKLRQAVGAAKTIPAKQAALWKLVKAWGRFGIFDKDGRSHVLSAVQEAASKINPEGRVGVLSKLAGFANKHGEITGRDPDNWHSMTDAIEKAQERGRDQRDKLVKKHERQRNRKISKIAGRGNFEGWARMLRGHENAYNLANQAAERLVALEPENLTDSYVGQEGSAWGSALDTIGNWRNTAVAARDYATAKIPEWQAQIRRIRDLRGRAFQKQKWRIQPLRDAITNAQTFIGERNDDLVRFQGYGGPQGPLGSLREGGGYWLNLGGPGASIFDTQDTIRQLSLKTLGGGGVDTSEADALKLALEMDWKKRFLIADAALPVLKDYDALMARVWAPFGGQKQWRTGPSFADEVLAMGSLAHRLSEKVAAPFAGFFARGGFIPAGMWGIAGEKGAEVVGPAMVTPLAPVASGATSGPPTLVIEQLVIHEDGRATMTYDNQEVEAVVKRVIRDTPLGGRVTSGGMR